VKNSAPGFTKFPSHRIAVKPVRVRVRVTYKGEAIADTKDAVALEEMMGPDTSTVAPIVYYLPRKDVKTDRLVRTPRSTHCPFKGDATYYSLRGGPEDAAWSYEKPYDEMTAIKGRLAFYPDKVEIRTGDA
jgi:uncharacterized protein (DUF427 family)